MKLDHSRAAPPRLSRRALFVAGVAAVLATSAAAQKVEPGVSITVSQTSDAQPANLMHLRVGNLAWVRNVFEPLTQINPKTFVPEPVLAKQWRVSDNGMSMDLVLRDDAVFHTGRKMTSEDVKYSLEVAAKPENAVQTGFIAREFESIDLTGPYSLTIKFKRPLSNVFDLFEQAVIVDKETYDKRVDGSKVVGTGPFQFVSWTPGASIKLRKFPGYRNAGNVQIADLEFAVIPDSTASISALRSQRTVLAAGLATSDLVEFSRNPMFGIAFGGGNIHPFCVNVNMPPFDKKVVRQALGYAVDRQRIIDQVFDGSGVPTALFWSPSAPGYTKALAEHYSYDPSRAKAMIEAAGAKGAKFPIIIPAIPANRSIFEIVQNNLREVGLDATANVLDVTEYDKRQIAGDLGPAFILIHSQVGFASPTLLSSLPSLRQGNPSHFWTDEYVKLRNAMTAATSPERLGQTTEALSQYMIDQAFCLPVVQAAMPVVIAKRLQGVELGAHGEIQFAGATLAR